MFRIDVQNLSWVQGGLACEDYCAHGHVTAWIGQEVFADDCTVSSTALYLLKSLTEDHIIYEGQQMLPCCGHTMIARENGRLDTVDISGCDNGIDWSVLHEDDTVRLITCTGCETVLPLQEYKKTVFAFADKIEAFYQRSAKKAPLSDEFEQKGYTAFWNEWHRRRRG